ncbi:unnamed protein product [Heterobilharzia americana]|nr:unnamed protein product [Heterobilharzia americana]
MPPAHSTLRISDTISVLTLLSVQPVDDGVYTCHILQSSSNSVNDEWWDKTEIMKSRVSSPTDKLKFTKDPAMQRLHLDVYHPPTSLNLTVFPRGPYKAGTNITFTCHIHGGKPKPLVHFYRTSARFDNGNISVINLNSYNPKYVLENITQKAQSTQLSWQLTEADNIVSFGCAAISPVIKDQMFSLFVEVEIIFPPDQPILSAVPHGPVSENRTKVFTCQSSKGSNPRAKILWELTPAMEYITTASKRDYMNHSKPSEKETVIKPVKNSDFEMEISDTHSNTKRDSNNGGYIAFSEVRLIGRPWFNGARVSCHLVWGSEVDYSAVHQNIYHKTVYLSVEVFFCLQQSI